MNYRQGAVLSWTPEIGRYFLASLLALAVDMGLLLLAARVMHYLWAATLGFAAGIAVSYLLATRWVFAHRRLASMPQVEFASYALIGLAGLVLNNLSIHAGVAYLELPLWLAKGFAAVVTFAFNFGVRRASLFRP